MKKPIIKKDASYDCVKDFTAELQKSALSLWLFAICCFFFGVICGIMFSPKRSFSVGCNNSAVTYEAEEEECKKGKCRKKK